MFLEKSRREMEKGAAHIDDDDVVVRVVVRAVASGLAALVVPVAAQDWLGLAVLDWVALVVSRGWCCLVDRLRLEDKRL